MNGSTGTGRVNSHLDGAGTPAFTMFGGNDTGGAAGALAAGSISRRINMSGSRVADVYFSQTNVDALQHGVRYGVYRASEGRHVIGRQSDIELALVMRSVYLEHSRNMSDSEDMVMQQVRALNKIVLDYCIPRILQEADMYIRYRTDVSTLPVPLPRGELATTKGDRSLVMNGF